MKNQNDPLFNSIFLEEGTNLTMDAKEILTAGCNPPRQKTFTNADLWNIHRQHKTVIHRRPLY